MQKGLKILFLLEIPYFLKSEHETFYCILFSEVSILAVKTRSKKEGFSSRGDFCHEDNETVLCPPSVRL